MPNGTNPWLPTQACPLSLVGLTIGGTVTAHMKNGGTLTGDVVAMSGGAMCIDSGGHRFYATFAAIEYLTWPS